MTIRSDFAGSHPLDERIAELLRQHQQSIYRGTDRLFAALLFFQWSLGILAAKWISPKTWIGESADVDRHFWGSDTPSAGDTEAEYDEHMVELIPGDRLWIYSDGVPEAMNSQLEPFGEERLNQSVVRHRDRDLQTTVQSVLDEVENWCRLSGPKDDVSLLAIEINHSLTSSQQFWRVSES